MLSILLFLHFVGIALSVGTGFAYMALGMATKDMSIPERGAYMLRAFALSRNGRAGLALLLVTGIWMVMLLGGFAAVSVKSGMAFNIKMLLVLVLLVVFGFLESLIKKAKREKGGPVMAKIPKFGSALLLLGLSIIACAVLAFH